MLEIYKRIAIILIVSLPFLGFSQENQEAELSLEELMNRNVVDMSIEDWVDLDNQELNKLSFYGFLNFNMERVFNEPTLDEFGNTVYETGAFEMSQPNFHIYGGSKLSDAFTVFFNLGKNDDNIELVNAWGNWKFHDMLQLRVGKQYRRFDLFNERLDQVPTLLGIEPPELFDNDHLLLPRTSLATIHGVKEFGNKSFKYFLTTSNGESGAEPGVVPLGTDFRYVSSFYLFGLSTYTSNLGSAKSSPSVGIGEGAPSGGILPWMAGSKYNVFGVYTHIIKGNFGVKAGYYVSNHDAERDPESVITLAENGLLNANQIDRMIRPGANLDSLTTADVNVNGDYTVNTWYLRLSYQINTTKGLVTPYLFFDYYENPETIGSKGFGGDNEAGVADDGKFLKPSLGLVYRPIEKVAIKLDASSHHYNFNGSRESYPEVRLDISYMFK